MYVTTLRCRPEGTYLLHITDTEVASVCYIVAESRTLCDCALIFEMISLIEALRWCEKSETLVVIQSLTLSHSFRVQQVICNQQTKHYNIVC